MRKFLIVVGVIFSLLTVVAGGGITYLFMVGSGLDRESKAYAEDAIPAIVKDWDIRELDKRTSPEFKSAANNQNFTRLWEVFTKLGKLDHFDGVRGQANLVATAMEGTKITANYVGSAEFDAGRAEIDLGLIKHGNDWQILRFRVNSEAFLPK